MGYSKKIDIRLNTTANLSGVDKAKRSLSGIGDALGKLGSVLGGANSLLGDFFKNLAKGSVWQMGASAIGYAYKKIVEYINAAKEAERQAAKEAKEATDERLKALNAYAAAADKLTQARSSSINQNLKSLNEEVDATKELTKATLELQKAEARRNGDSAKVENINRDLDSLDYAAARDKLSNEINATRQKRASESQALKQQQEGLENAQIILQKLKSQQAAAISAARDSAIKSASNTGLVQGAIVAASPVKQAKIAAKAENELRKTDDFKALAAQIAEATQKAKDFQDKINASRQSLSALRKQEQNLRDRLQAADISQQAKETNAETDRLQKQQEAAQAAQAKSLALELKAQQEAAAAREKLDRELHQKRMNDLKEELAQQAKAAAPLRAIAASASNEFDRAFALYRDPQRAKEAIKEEQDYQNDLKRLHTEAARYGGAWRISQLSQLMAAGDSEGQANTLAAWRKSKSFTPEIEALVRASAAEQTRTSAEEELRKIEHNTANLAQKVEDLLTMKG